MKKTIMVTALCAVALLAGERRSFCWDLLDSVIAVVNDRPIVESEVAERFSRISARVNIPRARVSYEKSRVLDKFIDEAIVNQEAEQQSIIVSDEKVNNHIEKMMHRMNVGSIEDFKKRLERTEKMPFEEYKEEIRKSLVTEQVMQLAIGVTPPTRKEALAWYNDNRAKLGYEVNIRHILLRPKNAGYAEEKRVSDEIKKIRQRIQAGESFESLASSYSEDTASAKKGGDLGWVSLGELDPYFANEVYKLNAPGQLSGAIKSSSGYHLVKYLGRRQTTFDTVEDRISNMLFQQKMAEQFVKWVAQRKRESDIKIFMIDYVKG